MADRGMPGNVSYGHSPPNPRTGVGTEPNRGMGTYERKKGTKPVSAPYELTTDAFQEGTRWAKDAKRLEENYGYPNLANQKFVEEQARAAVLAGLKDTFNVHEFLRNKWLIFYRMYRGESLDNFAYGRMRLHSPEPFKAVETWLPKMQRAVFGSERWFKFYGELEQHDPNAEAQERLCRHQLRDIDFMQKATALLRNGLIYGTGIQKCYWKQTYGEMKYRTAKEVPDENGFPGMTKLKLSEITRQELTFDGNEVENVSVFDFLTSPSASSIDDAEWCADRSSWPDWKVKEMGEMGHWINLYKLRDHPGSNDMSFGDEFKERKAYAYGVFDPREASFAPHIPHYEVIDWWGPLVVKDENGAFTTRMCNVVMVEPESLQLVVSVRVNPYWHQKKPYQAWRPINLHEEFYGIGVLEMIARLSMEKDAKRNLLMTATQLEANPMWMVSDEANIPDGQLLLQPGGVVRVPSIQDSIAPLHLPQVSDAALKAENVLTKDLRETHGATSPSMGASDPFNKDKTATQHMAEVDEANLRLLPMLQNFEHDLVIPMFNQMIWNNQQFLSYDKVVRELGQVGLTYHNRYTIRPQDLIGRFLVQPLASHRLTTKQTQVQQLVNILDRAPIINQMYGPDAVDMTRLLAMILEQGFDIRNVDDFIKLKDSDLLTPEQEHHLWYRANVPPRRRDDNDMRHYVAHMEEIGTEDFKELENRSPATAAKVRSHIMEHAQKLLALQLEQENMMMKMSQFGAQQEAMGGGQGQSPVAGANGMGQEPTSPNVRRNENQRGEGTEAQSEAMRQAPNEGAQ